MSCRSCRSWCTFPWGNRPAGASVIQTLDQASGQLLQQLRQHYWQAMQGALREPIGTRVMLDKNPELTALLPLVARVFPEMKIVFALRRPARRGPQLLPAATAAECRECPLPDAGTHGPEVRRNHEGLAQDPRDDPEPVAGGPLRRRGAPTSNARRTACSPFSTCPGTSACCNSISEPSGSTCTRRPTRRSPSRSIPAPSAAGGITSLSSNPTCRCYAPTSMHSATKSVECIPDCASRQKWSRE